MLPSTGWSSTITGQDSFTVTLPEPFNILYGDGEQDPYDSLLNGGSALIQAFNSSSFILSIGVRGNRPGFNIKASRFDAYSVQLIDFIHLPPFTPAPDDVPNVPITTIPINEGIDLILDVASCCALDGFICIANGDCLSDGTHKAGSI